MHDELPIDEFLKQARVLPVVDVRTPAEHAAGHIPGAVNVPLFSNEERAEVGTLYRHEGREKAVLAGLARVAPKMTSLAERMLELAAAADGALLVHCWRGGMRSASMAWLAGTVGCRAATLAGGYKAFRRWALASLQEQREVRVVAGLTGTGKTGILRALADLGEPVIDLEALARHKGSAFGDLGEEAQPTQEQFENELAVRWTGINPSIPPWLEDESRMIGRRVMPEGVWHSKRGGRYHVVEIPDDQRVFNLCRDYANHPADELERRIHAIRERLGGQRAQQAIDALRAGDHAAVCGHLLHYYDRTYSDALAGVPDERMARHRFAKYDPMEIASALKSAFC